MFSVIFEVHPRSGQWDAYLDTAKLLRPELEQVDGFVDNIRYRSLTRDGWVLSLSGWRDEKAVVRWRTKMRHHMAQEKGRAEILRDYHLRVGQVTHDTEIPAGHRLQEQRLDETEVGEAAAITLVTAQRPADWPADWAADWAGGKPGGKPPRDVATWLGHDPAEAGCVGWDVFDAVLTPGALILLQSWRSAGDAAAFARGVALRPGARLRQVRVVRDYGMFDRREAPQYYPDAPRAAAV
jgi:heme-degrading monooxygenase HmoA